MSWGKIKIKIQPDNADIDLAMNYSFEMWMFEYS